MKMTKTNYGGEMEILKFSGHSVAIPITIDSSSVTAVGGKKILKGGTILGGKAGKVMINRDEGVVKKNTADAEGVLLWDVDVTDGDAPASMVIHGFVNLGKLPENPTVEAIAALKLITFLN